MTSSLKVLVVLGSMREGRMADRVSKFIQNKVKQAGHSPTVLDPEALPNEGTVVCPLHFHRDPSKIPQWMTDTNEIIKGSDCVIVVTPEYNCAPPPALLAVFNNFPPASFRHKPVSIVCYSIGQFGGLRAAALVLPFFNELGLVPLPKSVVIPNVPQKLSEDGTCLEERVSVSADALVREMTWYANALNAYAATVPPPPKQ
ncbi:uncharacterized protein LOC108667737 [Hyalella azteca]|uniref:Uncharacterized protein LOC108667737 n=1 Tax=Hyalella azteca TaxID=294128 RepID=A0A8B7N9Y2_HYAAZ|nr:uncharacterized protein LOC108667737 [Hyalella azteca]XP_018010289.1 uncharacterized protein LOC108667737 [Hyalella azteca]XP_047740710.1 uncharacterized protein LOC108667737 [Hyalella azteca]